jgi:hypothetical protein
MQQSDATVGLPVGQLLNQGLWPCFSTGPCAFSGTLKRRWASLYLIWLYKYNINNHFVLELKLRNFHLLDPLCDMFM